MTAWYKDIDGELILTGTSLENPYPVNNTVGGNSVSNTNPLPTALDARTSVFQAVMEGKNFYISLTAPAVVLKYSAVQIWNPVGSGVVIIVNPLNGYNSTGTLTWTRIKSTAALTSVGGYSLNTKFSITAPAKAELRYDELTSLTVSNSYGSPSITATGGVGASVTSGLYVLSEGEGIQLEGNTKNVGMTLIGFITEIPTSEFNA